MSAPAEVVVGRIVGAPVERKEDKKLLQGQAVPKKITMKSRLFDKENIGQGGRELD